MTPTTAEGATRVGEWVALVDDEIVARGATEEEAFERAWERGYRDITLARVAEPGTYVV